MPSTSLFRKLEGIVERYKSDILIIKDFVSSTYDKLDNFSKVLEDHKSEFTNEDSEALTAFAEVLKEAVDEGRPGKKTAWRKTVQTTPRATQIILKAVQNMKSQEFLAEMALSYIVSFQEGFIKDYLEEVLYSKPKLIISNKSLSYEVILRFTSVSTLRRYIAKSETDILGYGSIDDLEVYFQKKFNITLHQEPFWPGVKEASYRRNLIIHNRGVINKIYREKMGLELDSSKLETKSEYIAKATDDIVNFVNFVHHSVTNKLKLKKGRQHVDQRR